MELKKLKLMEVPEIKPINVPKRQSLQEWHFANGSVPERYKGNPHAWHKKVQRLAEGGSVYNTQPDMSDGGQIIPEQQMARGGAAKAKPFKASDLAEPFTEGLFPMIYGGAKGTVAGLAGLPGELEALARAGYNYGSRLSPQAPLSRETFFPTIEEVSRALPSTGRKIEEPYTKLGENMLSGLVNPAAVYRTGARGVNALRPTLGNVTDRYMTEMGMMPGVVPKKVNQPLQLDDFISMATKGKVNPAKDTAKELADLKSGKSKFAELQLNWDMPETYDLADELAKKGFKSKLNDDGITRFYKKESDLKSIESAKTPIDYGKAYGYSDEDIAAFYVARRGGNKELGYKDFLNDQNALAKLGQAGAKLSKEEMGMMPGVAPKGMPAPKGEKPIVVRTPEEQSIIDKFGQKQKQEAARAKKVEKANKLAEESAGKTPEKQIAKPGGQRGKVDPDVYRKMAASEGEEAVLKAVMAGEHLKPTSKGFVGAPRTVTNMRTLNAMRRGMDQDFSDSVDAVKWADPDRMGTWYDRAKQGMEMSTEPHQLPRTLEQHAVYSAGVSPENELAFALKHGTSRGVGDPVMAYRGAGMKKLDEAVQNNKDAKLAFKIGEYKNKNDPRLPNTGLFGVDDFRRAQGMQYTLPEGGPWQGGVTDTMHPFMDAETALQVGRINDKGIGGRTDWHGPHIQELPWVYGKAQDFYGRGSRSKSGKYFGDEAEGMKQSLVDANNTARDYFYKHTLTPTAEAIPGLGLGHVESALSMTPEEKLAYSQRGRFDVPYPSAESPEANAATRDAFYSALNLRQMPARQGQGMWINPANEVENNPLLMPRVLVDFPTGGGGMVAPSTRKAIDVIEQNRALMDAQHGGGYNLPNTQKGVTGKNALVIDSRSRNPSRLDDPSAGVMPTAAELTEMDRIIKANTKKGQEPAFGVTATERGVLMYPYDSNMDPKTASSFIKKVQGALTQAYPGEAQKALATANYVPGVGKRSDKGPITTAPYSGEATSDLLSAYSEIPQHVATNVGESEAIRRQIREKMLRDEEAGGARGDIQETRRFFSEADWPKAVEMIRQGMAPAAAIAALGYNAASMAQEKP